MSRLICDTSRAPLAVGCRAAWLPSLHLSPLTGQLRIDPSSLVGRVVELDGETVLCRDIKTDEVFSARVAEGDIQRVCNLREAKPADRSVLGHLEVTA